MNNLRTYSKVPFKVAVIHGGPGAGGEMAPVARELAKVFGVLEPIQTAESLDGQVDELKAVLEDHGELPVTLIGFSWGAWLSFIVAAKFPFLANKLILVGCGGFEEKDGIAVKGTRLSRLDDDDKIEFENLLERMNDSESEMKDELLARLGELVQKTDNYNPVDEESMEGDYVGRQGRIFHSVWKDAEQLRRSGVLLKLANRIVCPVVAIHGDFDPHPSEGVKVPLSGAIKNFRFISLEKCGHKPWIEREAREKFYEILREECV